jgi:multidrug efflux pump subunit AcrA (membrane-fusion protein)
MLDANGRVGLMSDQSLDVIGLSKDTRKQQLNMALAVEVLQSGQPTIHVPGESGKKELPTSHVLLLIPIRFREQWIGIVELFLPIESPPEFRLEHLRFTEEMAAFAARYLDWRDEATSPTNHLEFWNRFEQFTAALHRSLDPREVAGTAVNDGRQLLGCDRVSLALRRGPKAEIVSISGQDRVHKRSNLVRMMRELSTRILRAGKSVTYAGSLHDVPPVLEKPLTDYVKESGSRMVHLVPLKEPPPFMPHKGQRKSTKPPKTLGVLVIEKTEESWLTPLLAERAEMVASHIASAMQNAKTHQGIFLLPFWKWLGRGCGLFQGRTFLKFLAAVYFLSAAVSALALIDAPYRVVGKGQFLPVKQQDIFAPWDGEVVEIYVKSGQHVKAGQPLVKIQNVDLETELIDSQNKWEEKRQLQKTLESSIRAANTQHDQAEEIRLRGRLAQTQIEKQGLEERIARIQQQIADLTVTAPFAGTVATFQLEQMLQHRPVAKGERLLEIMDEAGEWHLELEVPENRLGHMLEAERKGWSESLPVDFVLATQPEESYKGTLKATATRTDVSLEEGSIVKVQVSVDKSQLPHCRIGAEVQGKIHCGDKSLFYVLFGDVVEFVQRRIW